MRGGIRARTVLLPPTGETEQLKHTETTPPPPQEFTNVLTHLHTHTYLMSNTRPLIGQMLQWNVTLHVIGTFQLSALLVIPHLTRIKDKDKPFKYNPTAVKHFKCSIFVGYYVVIRNCP